MREDETEGVYFLKNESSDSEHVNETFITLIPSRFHNEPEVIEAKKDEISKWKLYEAFEEVEEHEDFHIISSNFQVRLSLRWEVNGIQL